LTWNSIDREDWSFAGWRFKRRLMKRAAVWAFYAVSVLAILYLALYAYAALRRPDLTPGDPIHIFRKPDAPDYS
jgi:hypothetical protein